MIRTIDFGYSDTKKQEVKREYQKLSQQVHPIEPQGDNLVMVISDIHGDLYPMLEPLLRDSVIKLTEDDTCECGYKMEKGDFADNFKRIVFTGDYVDRGKFSPEIIRNVLQLEQLFNTEEAIVRDRARNDTDTIKFLCGNHDTLLTANAMDFNIFTGTDDLEIHNLISNSDKRKIFEDFEKTLAIAHVEDLESREKIYFTHSYCTAGMKSAIDKKTQYILPKYEEPIDLLNKGGILTIDKKTSDIIIAQRGEGRWQYDYMRDFILPNYYAPILWLGTEATTLFPVPQGQEVVPASNEVFIHGHEPVCLYNSLFITNHLVNDYFVDSLYAVQKQNVIKNLSENGITSIDFANTSGYRETKRSSSNLIINQNGEYLIEGSYMPLDGYIVTYKRDNFRPLISAQRRQQEELRQAPIPLFKQMQLDKDAKKPTETEKADNFRQENRGTYIN